MLFTGWEVRIEKNCARGLDAPYIHTMTVVRYRKIRPATIANQIAAFAGYHPLTLGKKIKNNTVFQKCSCVFL